MTNDLNLLAQLSPDDIELTAGRVIAGLMFMSALAGSLMMIAIWIARHQNGHQLLPVARRAPLWVPVPLMLAGIALTTTLAILIMTSETPPEPAATDETAKVSLSPVDDDSVAVPKEGDAEAESTSAAEDVDADAPSSEQLSQMLTDTMQMNLMIFAVFGLAVWLCQPNRPERYASGSPAASIADAAEHSLEFVSTLAAQDQRGNSVNAPYSAPPEMLAHGAALPGVHDIDGLPAEPWNLLTELRFALEAVLVAFIPVAAVRLLILQILPESPSHPFLEMMEQGIEWWPILLITLMAVVVAPLVEELLYRVTILGGLMQHRLTATGLIVSSLLFSFAHGFPDSIALLPLAFIIGFVYIQRRSYRTVMLIHFLFNAFNMVVALLSLP